MYSVLIVEDEYYVRSSIIHRIDWESLGLRVVGEADDGMKALEILQNTSVDILLTDIRMPEMDGIELISAARQLNPRIQCVIISGHDDFIYTKSAIRLGVSDYIQKPIDEDELSETLLRIVHQLDIEKNSGIFSQPANPQLAQQLALQKTQRQLEYIFAGHQTDFPVVPGEKYAVILLWPGLTCDTGKLDQWLQSVSLDHARLLGSICREAPVYLRLLLCSQEMNEESLLRIAKQLLKSLQGALGDSALVRCGLSYPANDISEVSAAHQHALRCLKSKMLYPDAVISPAMLAPQNMDELNIAINIIFELREALSQRNKKKVQMQVNLLFAKRYQHVDTLHTILRYISDIVNEHVVRYHVDGDDLTRVLSDSNALLSFESMDDLRSRLVPMILDFFFFNKHLLDDNIIRQVQLYIRQHMADDLKITTLGQVFFLSPNHLSFLFKKETGYTLSDYVENVRMERARVLLSMNYSIVEVASQVGYSDASYFSRVFKKTTGISPQKYQQEYKITSN